MREAPLPTIIQGGMGVSVSSWQLAHAVARTGNLGVVSGTGADVVMARRLQLGDPGGHIRRALAHFPYPDVSRRVMRTYYVHGGMPETANFRTLPRFTLEPSQELMELTVAANFAEVWLAKEGHDGPVGVNYLRKIELPLPYGLLGAILAGVDYVIVGAGNPAEIPGMVRTLAAGQDLEFSVRGQGFTSKDAPLLARCSPSEILGTPVPQAEPRMLAIAASAELAEGLAGNPVTRPFGFVLEGPTAGGHNAPPRGPRRTDDLGQPVYDERDAVDVERVAALGLPFWLAGSYGSPEGLASATSAGATGIQVGTAFAYTAESGMAPEYKKQVLTSLAEGTLEVRTDWRASPTGFPFKVVQAPGTLSDPEVAERRKLVCDLSYLRVPYKKGDGEVDYRCPAEPVAVYTGRKGGRVENTEGRKCLCNGLLATAGLPQRRPKGVLEPAVITSGDDFSTVSVLMEHVRSDQDFYTAQDVLDHLEGRGPTAAGPRDPDASLGNGAETT
jgi:NAD(P)H-dependent flavin oxidoreductase YrpB (nitropropane dioxygenase family)